MKTVKSLMICFFLIAFFQNAISQTSNTSGLDSVDSTKISFENIVYDYGKIKKGGNGDCAFTFKNTGKKPLVLTNVRASCGCTTPSWPKEPILPGKSGEIKVHYDTNRMGSFQKAVTVSSNAQSVTLTIKGLVEE